MFKNFIDLVSGDQRVIGFSDKMFVYPIFKNARTSLEEYARKKELPVYVNEEINKLSNVTIYLREPIERFVSGVNTYFYQEQLPLLSQTLTDIEHKRLVNKHFAPQYIWLFALHKYFDGYVTIRQYKELFDLIPDREGPWSGKNNTKPWIELTVARKNIIMSISHNDYTKYDYLLMKKYMYKTIKLQDIIRDKEIKDAVS